MFRKTNDVDKKEKSKDAPTPREQVAARSILEMGRWGAGWGGRSTKVTQRDITEYAKTIKEESLKPE